MSYGPCWATSAHDAAQREWCAADAAHDAEERLTRADRTERAEEERRGRAHRLALIRLRRSEPADLPF